MATGEKVTITCRTSTDIDDDMNWYQQKPGQAPRLLISEGNTLNSGVPSRFMSSGYGTDFTLKIDGIQSDDAANYFCQQSDNSPLTVIYPFTETCRRCLPAAAEALQCASLAAFHVYSLKHLHSYFLFQFL